MARPPLPSLAVLIVLALIVVRPGPTQAATTPTALSDGGQATVSAVIDGDTVMLADGRQVRLVGIQAPKLPLDRPEGSPWPLADSARSALAALVLDRTVRLAYGGTASDRYGRVLAQLHTADGTWVQGELLRQGLARVRY
jgi:micrococcal nuclease